MNARTFCCYWLSLVAVCAIPLTASSQEKKGAVVAAQVLPVVYQDDFEKGAANWKPFDAKQWKVAEVGGKHVFSQFEKKSTYSPPHRSPLNVALLKDVTVGDLVLTLKVKSTHADYGHRDACIVFGYQDPAHFYYVHLGAKTDDHANQIFIVNNAPRIKISTKTTEGTKWTDDWHTVKVVRRVADGAIEVYYDDMKTPCMTAADKNFAWGQIGMGTFDDTADFDDVELRGVKVEKKTGAGK
jgi:hypothetical protein